jgi:hypothetical protein
MQKKSLYSYFEIESFVPATALTGVHIKSGPYHCQRCRRIELGNRAILRGRLTSEYRKGRQTELIVNISEFIHRESVFSVFSCIFRGGYGN